MATPDTGTARPGLSVGPTSEFSLFFRVKPGQGETVREALRGSNREVLELWFGHIDEKALLISQSEKPDGLKPDRGDHRSAEAQILRLNRAIQVATPSAMIFYGSPESPTR